MFRKHLKQMKIDDALKERGLAYRLQVVQQYSSAGRNRKSKLIYVPIRNPAFILWYWGRRKKRGKRWKGYRPGYTITEDWKFNPPQLLDKKLWDAVTAQQFDAPDLTAGVFSERLARYAQDRVRPELYSRAEQR